MSDTLTMRAKETKRITFRVNNPFLAELNRAAREDSRSLSGWIKVKLQEAIDARQNGQPAQPKEAQQ